MNKENYLEILKSSYDRYNEILSSLGHTYQTKWQFIGDTIFNFTTYENLVLTKMSIKALEVALAITTGKTFDYISKKDNNTWYLIMVNMDFFMSKISWGCSIRGAFWDTSPREKFEIETDLWIDNKQVIRLEFTKKEWQEFILAMVEFVAAGN